VNFAEIDNSGKGESMLKAAKSDLLLENKLQNLVLPPS
jgi:hypothetical protein